MRIRELKLENIKCFKDQTLSFTDDENKFQKWTVILGENGTGKTTILQSIALILSGNSSRQLCEEPRHLIRGKHKEARITATLEFPSNGKYPKKPKTLELQHTIVDKPFKRGWKNDFEKEWNQYEDLFYSSIQNFPLVCGYGATRLSEHDEGRLSGKSESDPLYANLVTLFDEYRYLPSISGWLRNLEYLGLKSNEESPAFNKVNSVISKLMPGFAFKEITNKDVIFKTPYGESPISHLPKGFIDVLTWIIDFLRLLLERYPNSRNPLKEPAIVLVEEIAQNLHPSWQREIISFLRKKFSNTQFIVTTHAPLVAQSLEQGELVFLNRKKRRKPRSDEVEINRSELSPKSLNIQQLLTSNLFGLETTRSKEVHEKHQEAMKLKKKAMAGQLKNNEKRRYAVLKEFFDVNEVIPGETFDDRDQFAQMKEVLIKLGREDLLEMPPADKIKRKKGS